MYSQSKLHRSLLRSGHVKEWGVEEAIDTLLKVASTSFV